MQNLPTLGRAILQHPNRPLHASLSMTNKNFYSACIKGKRAVFAPFDFHVHTLGSADVRIGKRYAQLPDVVKSKLPILSKEPPSLEQYDIEMASTFPPEEYYSLLLAKKRMLFDGAPPPNGRGNWGIVA